MSVFSKCSECLPSDTSESDIPQLPHCEFVCFVDSVLRQRKANEMLNHVLFSQETPLS